MTLRSGLLDPGVLPFVLGALPAAESGSTERLSTARLRGGSHTRSTNSGPGGREGLTARLEVGLHR